MSADRTGPPCPDLPDTCGAPAGTPCEPCEPWCASQAADASHRRTPSGGHSPIERAPRAVRPPYDVPDSRLAAIDAAHGTDVWRAAVRLDRLAALREPLRGLHVTEYEARQLEYLAGEDTPTVAVLAGLLHRARAAAPLADKPGPAEPDQ